MGPKTTWSDFQVEQQLTVKGGLLTSPMVIKAKRVEVAGNGNPLTFVKLCKKEDWLCKVVTGPMSSARTMSRCTLLQGILAHLNNDGKERDAEVEDAGEAAEDLGAGLDWEEGEDAAAAPAAQSKPKPRTQY